MKAMLMSSLFISCVCGFMVVFSMRAHLLLTLFGMEFLMIILYMFLFITFKVNGLEMNFLILFLVMLVCEGSLGLSILVSLIRSHGNDMVNSLYMMLW
uniref:NADH-ubiquinone oxidoreductase chain 4L n=1 Tax=Cysteochila chiniana TaxID=2172476 RepID=A0A343WNL9_9HEMI|nr:NADH dehydrogenase subunit 4L [Cysteochila chiniana]AWD31595.1 NADH dehydrogenase subunit 4L [Cysteochila chiniana]